MQHSVCKLVMRNVLGQDVIVRVDGIDVGALELAELVGTEWLPRHRNEELERVVDPPR